MIVRTESHIGRSCAGVGRAVRGDNQGEVRNVACGETFVRMARRIEVRASGF